MIALFVAAFTVSGGLAIALSDNGGSEGTVQYYNAVFLDGDTVLGVVFGPAETPVTAPVVSGEKEIDGITYTFDGWLPEVSNKLTQDVVYRAQWTAEGESLDGDYQAGYDAGYTKGLVDGANSVEQEYTEVDVTEAYGKGLSEGYAKGQADAKEGKDGGNEILYGCLAGIFGILFGILLIITFLAYVKGKKTGVKLL